MKRRQVITGLLAAGVVGAIPYASRHRIMTDTINTGDELPSNTMADIEPPLVEPLSDHENRHVVNIEQVLKQAAPESVLELSTQLTTDSLATKTPAIPPSPLASLGTNSQENGITPSVDALAHTVDAQSANATHPTPPPSVNPSSLNKVIYFEQDYDDDIFVSDSDHAVLHSVHLRLKNLQRQIGYGHFNILNFDDALTFAKRFDVVGKFTPVELAFIEKIFTTNAADYGFYGEKVIPSLTDNINKQHTFKVPYTGHYLFKDQSFQYYKKLREHIGEGIILTSGIRSNVKQLHLFLAKVVRVKGNLSRASRSLAPPGYSYHGIGDFDVGRKGWGGKNFTDAFSQTDEFKRMQDLGYVTIRYDEGNHLGVRFEPWHIQVV
ncbi:M15 family metallopeptidase [Eionea flava]